MKYVMFARQLKTVTQYVPVIFPNVLVHADMAESFYGIMEHREFRPVSAGEVHWAFSVGSPLAQAVCYGRSETLKLDSEPERDSRIITMIDYGGGLGT